MVHLQHQPTILHSTINFALRLMTLTCASCLKPFTQVGYMLHGQCSQNELCRQAFMAVLAERLQDQMLELEGNIYLTYHLESDC